MHDIDWKWCPHVAAHEITRNFLISQARLQKAGQTLEAYARDLDDLLEAFADLPFADVIEADCGLLELYIDGLYNRPPKHEARAERDEAKQQAKAERAEGKQRAQAERADVEQRYHKLLQEHMQCGVTIAKLEAQVAEYLAFMERLRSSLQREEHG